VAHVNRRPPGRTGTGGVFRWLLLVLALLQLGIVPVLAEETLNEAVAERRVQAAYLYRFAGYAEWPDAALSSPDSPLQIGIWGNDALAEDLAQLVAARTVNGRRVRVRKLKDAESLSGLHVLYIGRERSARIADAMSALPARGTLVVTNSAAALQHGSAINFLLVDGQVRFEASPQAAEARGITLSSRLLAVSQNLSGQAR
jgi:hypothetical protein